MFVCLFGYMFVIPGDKLFLDNCIQGVVCYSALFAVKLSLENQYFVLATLVFVDLIL